MSREIRRVPLDWEHPKDKRGQYIPLYDESYREASERWIAEFELWQKGEHPDQPRAYSKYFWEWEHPPSSDTHREREWTPEEAIGYQVYQTVSEGTPVSPIFESLEALEAWLVEQGYSPSAAANFARIGSAPSMMFSRETGILEDIESLRD